MKIFGTRFWGFSPDTQPFVGFTHPGSRDSLIRRSAPGDLVVVLGTTTTRTSEPDRGKLLGLIEFEQAAADVEELWPEGVSIPDNLLDENRRFRWPHAVPAIRAWRFEPAEHIKQVIGRQLTSAAITGIDELSADEAAKVLALPRVEIDLGDTRVRRRTTRLNATRSTKLDADREGQPGPPPSEWSALVARQDGPTATYLMQFGESDVWKVGISQNPVERCKALNFSVPDELLKQQWRIVMTQPWPNGAAAYDMEQSLLLHLAARCTKNERVRCSAGEVQKVWFDFMQAKKN